MIQNYLKIKLFISKIYKIMKIDVNNPKHLIADEGKVLRQISSGIILGNEVYLGKVLINGELVDDFVENFEEIEDVKPEDNKE